MPNPDLFPGFFQPVFAHFRAGHRRPCDLQACIEELDWSPFMTPLRSSTLTLSLNQWEAVSLASSSETFGLTLR